MDAVRRDESPPSSSALPDRLVAQAMVEAEREAAKLDDGTFIAEEPGPLIEPGEYRAVGLSFKYAPFPAYGPDRAKCTVTWQVIVPDPEAEMGARIVKLPRYYNVTRGKGRHYSAPRNGDMAREWMLVTGRRMQKGRASAKVFVGMMCDVQVVTVEKDAKGRQLGRAARESKVGCILRHVAGGSLP